MSGINKANQENESNHNQQHQPQDVRIDKLNFGVIKIVFLLVQYGGLSGDSRLLINVHVRFYILVLIIFFVVLQVIVRIGVFHETIAL